MKKPLARSRAESACPELPFPPRPGPRVHPRDHRQGGRGPPTAGAVRSARRTAIYNRSALGDPYDGIGIRVARVSRSCRSCCWPSRWRLSRSLRRRLLPSNRFPAATWPGRRPWTPSSRRATETWSAGASAAQRWTIVQSTIAVPTADGVISTINRGTASVLVAAGGFEGVTNLSFVFTLRDLRLERRATQISTCSAMRWLRANQGGTAHFSPDNPKAYDLTLGYAVVNFSGMLSGEDAKAFFDHLGTIDAALWSSQSRASPRSPSETHRRTTRCCSSSRRRPSRG